MKERIYSIDFLRGLMAISVMIYHYISWMQGGLDATSVWSRFGIYAVTIFYFVSGFSMSYAYWENKHFNIKKYTLSRFFRIAPLFYVVSLVFVAYQILAFGEVDLYKLFLNFTFLFSIVEPSSYFSTGAWSIGNEMFFYCVFAFIVMSKNKLGTLVVLTLISFLILIYFRTNSIAANETLSSQWNVYIHPFNHLLTFLIGCLAYFIYKNYYKLLLKYKLSFGVLGLLIFYIPISGDRVNLVVGINSLLLLLSSFCIFMFFVYLNEYSVFRAKWASFLGDISYSIYLVHPVCWFVIERIFFEPKTTFGLFVFWFCAIVFSLITCLLTYFLIEKPGINFGKKLTKNGIK